MNVSGQNGPVLERDGPQQAIIKNVIVISLGLAISYINGTFIHTFRKHKILNANPRYVLFVHLVISDMIHVTTAVTLFVASYIFQTINGALCCVIISLAVFTTINSPLNLALMALQCYIVICFPLRHTEFCSMRRTYIAIALVWVMSSIAILPDIGLVVATDYRELFKSTIFCERSKLLHHPISKTKRDVLYAIYLVGVWIVLFYTYTQIFIAAKAAKSDGGIKKARNTILLHAFQLLLCILTYVYYLIVRFLVQFFPPVQVVFVSYIFIQIIPRFVSPLVYGLRDQLFRQLLKKHLLCGFSCKT